MSGVEQRVSKLAILVILVMIISLLTDRNNNWGKFWLMVEKKRKSFSILTFAFIIFFGCVSFPINIAEDNSFWLFMLIPYFYIAIILYGLYKKRPLFVFSITFLLNSLGLLCRVLLEWGEYSMTRDLTQLNVGLYLILIPALVIFIYYLVPRYLK